MIDDEPSARSIWRELEVWSSGFAPWQRHLLATAVRSRTVSRSALDQTYSLFLAQHSLAKSPDPYPDIPTSVTGRPADAMSKIRLRSIHSPRGVNRLPADAHLSFSDGMTVIYGGNGVGKSAFARILSNACFSRRQHPIYADIFDESAPSTPSASIEVQDDEGTLTTLVFDGSNEHALLKQGFCVFDSAVAERHLTDADPLGFIPTGFDIFPEVARGYAALQSLLAADIAARTRESTFDRSFIGPKTPASEIAARLNRHTNLETLRTLAAFGPSEHARVAQIQTLTDELKAKSPESVIRRMTEVRPQLLLLKERLSNARALLSEDQLAIDLKAKADRTAAAIAVARFGVEQFGHSCLQGVGSTAWKELVSSSQDFAREQHAQYPQEGDICILCHQPLGDTARELFQKYAEFATGNVAANLVAASNRVTARCAELRRIDLDVLPESNLAHSFLQEVHPTAFAAIRDTITVMTALRNSALSALESESTSDAVAIGDFDLTITNVVERLDADLELLKRDDPASSLATLDGERIALRHREVLSQNLEQMVSFVEDAQWVARAESARRDLNPRHVTDKEQELFSAVIAEAYRTALGNECEALSCGVPVELKTQGRKGQTVLSLHIRNRSPGEILSEGEQRSVALADFLTEVGLNRSNAGIIFDDPVTSLDHDRKELIAARLIAESRLRQVIIFTHDMVFFAKLCDAAAKAEHTISTHWMQRSADNRPGSISLNDGPTTTAQYRNTNFAEDSLAAAKVAIGSEQERLVRRGAGQLRRTVEEIIPQFLFKGVVKRWTDRVIVTALKNVNWDNALVDQLVDVFEACSAIMEGHSHTEAGTEAPPTPAKLEDLIKKTKQLIRSLRAERVTPACAADGSAR